jgi:thiamine-phosphate pyrophosphorylase
VSLDLSRPVVYLITNGECDPGNYDETRLPILETVQTAVECGVDLIQIREKRLNGKLLFELVERVIELTRGSRTKLLVNDRLDIALAAGADGVHLTANSVPCEIVKGHVPKAFLMGVSCHSAQDVVAAAKGGSTFALYGPVFASPGKGEGKGLEDLQRVCREANGFPVLTIGGIDDANFNDVLNAGAAGFAAIRALNDLDSLRRIMEKLGR